VIARSAHRLISFWLIAGLLAGCETSEPTPSSADARSTDETAPSRPQPPPTQIAAGTTSARPVAGYWKVAGTTTGRVGPHVLALPDGGALVVGDDAYRGPGLQFGWSPCLAADSSEAEAWDPRTGAWQAIPGLNKARGEFAAVALHDGRVLVTGGLNPGTTQHELQYGHESYSSTYLFDPRTPGQGWFRGGLLGTARTAPTASVLDDGRVLVAGGYYMAAATAIDQPTRDAIPAAYRPDEAELDSPQADISPPVYADALATAEVYDPVTDSWSSSGALNYARVGAEAVTLTDGRVLVVGSAPSPFPFWDPFEDGVRLDGLEYDTAEVFDPATGHFALTGQVPPIDVSALASVGIPSTPELLKVVESGTLVALDDGGALLVGRTESWSGADPVDQGVTSRSLRWNAASDRWAETGLTVSAVRNFDSRRWSAPGLGISRLHAVVARLQDGRILVAGGQNVASDALTTTSAAALFDPASNAWSAQPPMPRSRAGGAATTLSDGSVLIIGGYDATPEQPAYWQAAYCQGGGGLAEAVRYIPNR
jgi:hypothetical protein